MEEKYTQPVFSQYFSKYKKTYWLINCGSTGDLIDLKSLMGVHCTICELAIQLTTPLLLTYTRESENYIIDSRLGKAEKRLYYYYCVI